MNDDGSNDATAYYSRNLIDLSDDIGPSPIIDSIRLHKSSLDYQYALYSRLSRTLDHSSIIYSAEMDSIVNIADSEFDSAISAVTSINSIFADIFDDLNNGLSIDLNDIDNIISNNTSAVNHMKNVMLELNTAFDPNDLEVHSVVSRIGKDTLKYHYIDPSNQSHFIAFIEINTKSNSVLNKGVSNNLPAASVYPNPTSNDDVLLKIISSNSYDNEVFDVSILNASSSVISRMTVRGGYNILDVEKLIPGLYFIHISNDSNSFVLKFVKQ